MGPNPRPLNKSATFTPARSLHFRQTVSEANLMAPISLTVFYRQRLNIVADIFNLPAKTWGLGLNMLHPDRWLGQVQQVVSLMGAGQFQLLIRQ